MPTNIFTIERPAPSVFFLMWQNLAAAVDRLGAAVAKNGSNEPFGL